MNDEERVETLASRMSGRRPWHSPPHRVNSVSDAYLITAACYEHVPFIGHSPSRLAAFETALITTFEHAGGIIQAWVVLPNHYHVLARIPRLREMLHDLGRLHGRTSFEWNKEEGMRGRHVWHSIAETAMKSERHWCATINYIHHNPVKHRYVTQWQDWPYGSALAFLNDVGREEALALWKEYPIGTYGEGWDD